MIEKLSLHEVGFSMNIVKVDPWLIPKILKHYLLRDIENSFQKVHHLGVEPHQFFFLSKYLKKYAYV